MKLIFEEIKLKVLDIIDRNKEKTIDCKTMIKGGGIYVLYVDCFEDDRIIPFYIGQTSNFQERHKQHLHEILSLNRLDAHCYRYALLKDLYNGHYRACKIFSYMVNHQCEIKDLHMIILEEVEDEKERLKKEGEYINALMAPFVGFNQMNCVSQAKDFSHGTYRESVFSEIIEFDLNHLLRYCGYGYNSFNWYLANGFFDESQKEFVTVSGERTEYAKILTDKKHLQEIRRELLDIRNYNRCQCLREAQEICEVDIRGFFSNAGLRSEEKRKLVVQVLLFDSDEDKKELFNYFKRYLKGNTTDLIEFLNNKYGTLLGEIRKKILSNEKRCMILEAEEKEILERMFSLLIPMDVYVSHPLKSAYKKYQFPEMNGKNNSCHINIEYTCFKEDYGNDFYPEICKIDYYIVKNDVVYSREVFIKNQLEKFWNTDDIYYYEKGFRSGPFNIFLVGKIDTYIPVSMEYKNGINEYTMKEVPLEEAVNVFREIEDLIDDKTKITYTTAGYKSTIKRYEVMAKKHNLSVLKRLICMCR